MVPVVGLRSAFSGTMIVAPFPLHSGQTCTPLPLHAEHFPSFTTMLRPEPRQFSQVISPVVLQLAHSYPERKSSWRMMSRSACASSVIAPSCTTFDCGSILISGTLFLPLRKIMACQHTK